MKIAFLFKAQIAVSIPTGIVQVGRRHTIDLKTKLMLQESNRINALTSCTED